MRRLALPKPIGWSPAVRPDEVLIADAYAGHTEVFFGAPSAIASASSDRASALWIEIASRKALPWVNGW